MGELYQKTLDKKRFLENEGYIYISKWESDFDRDLSQNKAMAAFIQNLELVTSLHARDAFYGGRTEAFTLYKEASETETVSYYDVTSLYPFINKTGKVPLGHPEIITEDFGNLDEYEGLIKCKVLPPKGLFHPVLPCKLNHKLLFPLCRNPTTITLSIFGRRKRIYRHLGHRRVEKGLADRISTQSNLRDLALFSCFAI